MPPLTDDEAALLYHVMRWGSTGYPIARLGRKWSIQSFRSWKGFPVLYKTKREAIAQFEAWHALACDRLRAMREANPEHRFTITAVGIRKDAA